MKTNGKTNIKTNGAAKGPSKHSASKDKKEDPPTDVDNPHGFTSAQDSEMIEMKAATKPTKSWSDVSLQMGKPVWQLKQRWGVINPNRKGGGDQKNDAPAASKDKASGDKAKEKAERRKAWEEKAAKSKAANEGGADDRVKGHADCKANAEHDHLSKVDAASRMQRYVGGRHDPEKARKQGHNYKATSVKSHATSAYLDLDEDDIFTFGDIAAIAQIVQDDQELVWQRVASVFFNRTGRRMLPQEFRDKFESIIS